MAELAGPTAGGGTDNETRTESSSTTDRRETGDLSPAEDDRGDGGGGTNQSEVGGPAGGEFGPGGEPEDASTGEDIPTDGSGSSNGDRDGQTNESEVGGPAGGEFGPGGEPEDASTGEDIPNGGTEAGGRGADDPRNAPSARQPETGRDLTRRDLRSAAASATSGSGGMARRTDATQFGAFQDSVSTVEDRVAAESGLEPGEEFTVSIDETGGFQASLTQQERTERREQAAAMERAQEFTEAVFTNQKPSREEQVEQRYEQQLETATGAELSDEDVTTRTVNEDGEQRIVGQLTGSGERKLEQQMETASFTAKVPEQVPFVGGASQTVQGKTSDVDVESGADGGLNIQRGERDVFGNIDNPVFQRFERGVGSVTRPISSAASGAANLGEQGLDAFFERTTGRERDTTAGNLFSGGVEGVGSLPEAGGQIVTEGPELVSALATNPEARRQLPAAAAGTLAQTGEFAAANPARFTGSVVGTSALTAAAAPAVLSKVRRVSPRAAKTGEFVLDPVRVGSQGVRRAAGRARSADVSMPDAGPDVSIVRDPNSGILDVTPEARAEISDTLTPSRPSRSGGGGDGVSLSQRIDSARQRAAVELVNAELRRRDVANRVGDLSVEDAFDAGSRAARRARSELSGTAKGAAVSAEAAAFRARRGIQDFDARSLFDRDSDQLMGTVRGRALGTAASVESAVRRARSTSVSDLGPSRAAFTNRLPSVRDRGGDSLMGPVEGRLAGAAASGEAGLRRVLNRDFDDLVPSRGESGLLGPVEGRALGTAASVESALRRARDTDAGDLTPSTDVDLSSLSEFTIRVEPSRPPRTPMTRTLDARDVELTDAEADVFDTADADAAGDADATAVDAGNQQFDAGESDVRVADQQTVQIVETEAEATGRSIDDGPLANFRGSTTEIGGVEDSVGESVTGASESLFEDTSVDRLLDESEVGTLASESVIDSELASPGVSELERTPAVTETPTVQEPGAVETPTLQGPEETQTPTVGQPTVVETPTIREPTTTITPFTSEPPRGPPNVEIPEEDPDDAGMNPDTGNADFESDLFDTGIANVEEIEEQLDDFGN